MSLGLWTLLFSKVTRPESSRTGRLRWLNLLHDGIESYYSRGDNNPPRHRTMALAWKKERRSLPKAGLKPHCQNCCQRHSSTPRSSINFRYRWYITKSPEKSLISCLCKATKCLEKGKSHLSFIQWCFLQKKNRAHELWSIKSYLCNKYLQGTSQRNSFKASWLVLHFTIA